MRHEKTKDLTGQKFGKLTVLRFAGYKDDGPHNVAMFECRCECGQSATVRANFLKRGKTTSCGCMSSRLAKVHGKYGTSTHRIWGAMLQRCRNPKDRHYKQYGGRGISVCERWNDFVNFIADMGERPPCLTIERINNDGHYEPSNCRWATRSEQQNNRRTNHRITAFGKTQTMAQWSREFGINSKTLERRLRCGMPAEEALTRPISKRHQTTGKS